MLSFELNRTGVLPTHPEHSEFSIERPYLHTKFDLVVADGAVLESHKRGRYRTKSVEGVRLRASELVLALRQIKDGGTFVMLLYHMNTWETVQTLHDFQAFATVQIKKPTTSHKASSSFCMIAGDVRPADAAAIEGIRAREGRRCSLISGTPHYQTGERRGSLKSDDSTTAASWNSHESEKSQAICSNWIMKEVDLTRDAQAKQERETALRASAARIQDI